MTPRELLTQGAGVWYRIGSAWLHHDLGPLGDLLEDLPRETILAAVNLAIGFDFDSAPPQIAEEVIRVRRWDPDRIRSAAWAFCQLGKFWASQQAISDAARR